MSPDRIAFYALWLAPTLLRAVMAAFMLRKKMYHQFPAFFAYMVYQVLRTGILFVLFHKSQWAYYYGYLIGEVFNFVLVFAVIYEVLSHVLRPYEALWHLGRRLFLGAGALLVAVAVATAGGSSAALDDYQFMAWIMAAERSLYVVQCGLLVFMLLFSTYFGIQWRHHVFGIALGLGLFASVELAATAVRSEVGWIGHTTYSLVRQAAYTTATVIWAAYLLRPEPVRETVHRLPKTQVEQWNQALQEMWPR
ncbi:MAG: hypothetical protein ACRD24_11725 [Terriglobales bacterium]